VSVLAPPDSLIFDLDGTLWDTCASCAKAWNVVLRRNRIAFREITADDVRKVTGRPHDQCIRDTFVGFDEATLKLLSDETSVEDNRMIELHGGELYPGVAEVLTTLAARYPLFIVSNCQAGYIELFLRDSGLGALFRDFECWGNTGRAKPDNLRVLIARNRLAAPWFIGDAPGDHQAALACKVPFVFAAYGFSMVEGYDLRLETFSDLLRALAVI
jgi:phosphoglycolate phosphatase